MNLVLTIFGTLLFGMIGYLLGSISWAQFLVTKIKKQNILEAGSGNAGATNVVRVHGKKLGILVGILDVSKPLIAVLLAYGFKAGVPGFADLSTFTAGFCAIIGHCYPVFSKFKGGKGAACFGGFMIAINPLSLPFGLILFFGIFYWKRYVSLASLVSAFVFMVICWLPWLTQWPPGLNNLSIENANDASYFWIRGIYVTLATALIFWKHRANIKRLITHTELRFVKKTAETSK